MSSLDVTYSLSAVVEAAAVSYTHTFDYFWFTQTRLSDSFGIDSGDVATNDDSITIQGGSL